MPCESTDHEFARQLITASNRSNATNWQGPLPPIASREELHAQMAPAIEERRLDEEQVKRLLDFLVRYEERYYEASGGATYHRECGGGAMVESGGYPHCINCGPLADFLPPDFMR